MESIRYSDVPDYLREGLFYRSLGTRLETDEIQVPTDCFKSDTHISKAGDFGLLLRVLVFWKLDRIPSALIEYCHQNDLSLWESTVRDSATAALQSDLISLFGLKEEQSIEKALATNTIELIEHWIQTTEPSSKYGMAATTAACKAGRLDVLILLHQANFRWNRYVSEVAARNGHLACVKYLFENGCPWDVYTLSGAAWNGHLDCLIYGHEQGLEWHADVADAAANMGHLDVLQYLHDNGCPWDYRVVTRAAIHNHLPCLQYALEHDAPIDSAACTYACSGGRLEALQLMHKHGAQLTSNETTEAASYGKLDILQYLHQQGCPWTTDATDSAARESQPHTLRYAVENGCPCSADVVRLAAQSGHLPSLHFLVGERGLPMNEDGSIFGTAFLRANADCMEYLLSKGCPFNSYVFDWDSVQDVPADMVLQDADFLRCIKIAVQHGWQWNEALVEVIQSNKFPLCLKYIQDEGWARTS